MTVLVEKSATTLEDGIKTLIESAITDYKKRYGDGLDTDMGKKMVGDFINGFVVKSGQKYIKIMWVMVEWWFMLGFHCERDMTKWCKI